MSIDYKQSGVDIAAGEELVGWLKANQPKRWPHQERLVAGIGGFAALFNAEFPQMESPCLVSATDGVGTKIKLAVHFERYREVAQDLVAMCVNDLICSGASPLFFLDYYATGQLRLDAAKEFLSGLQAACVEAECALIGGETAEMPGVYSGKDFDCAGFAVGVVDRPKVLGQHRVQSGDRLIAVKSSGFHSNGFSLLRKLFEHDLADWEETLIRPTRLYVKLVNSLKSKDGLHAVAHITGGGLDNLLRVVPAGAQLHLKPWAVPAEFREVKKRAEISWPDLLTTLNCGIGLVLTVRADAFEMMLKDCEDLGYEAFDFGHVEISSTDVASKWHLDTDKLDG